MSAEEHRTLSPRALGFAVLTVSDSRVWADDTSGKAIRALAEAAGHRIVDSTLVRDDAVAIRAAGRSLLATAGVDVLVTTGGTGFSPRDVTLDALGPLIERPIEGFGELGAAAMLSRAAAGLVGTQGLFLLPGSPKAVSLAMKKLILPEAAHLIGQARRPQQAPEPGTR